MLMRTDVDENTCDETLHGKLKYEDWERRGDKRLIKYEKVWRRRDEII